MKSFREFLNESSQTESVQLDESELETLKPKVESGKASREEMKRFVELQIAAHANQNPHARKMFDYDHEAFKVGASWDGGRTKILKVSHHGPGKKDASVTYSQTGGSDHTKDLYNFQYKHTWDGK